MGRFLGRGDPDAARLAVASEEAMEEPATNQLTGFTVLTDET